MKLNRIKDTIGKEKGISQTWLAKQLGKSFSTVNCYARNKYQPDLETLLAISKNSTSRFEGLDNRRGRARIKTQKIVYL